MSKLFKPIGQARCILVRHDWEDREIEGREGFKFKITKGKIYDVLAVWKEQDEWLLIVADDGNRGSYRRDWFEFPL